MTEADFINFLQNSFPLFTEDDISKVLLYYPSSNASVMSSPGFATSGTTNPTALNESSFGIGQQQRADVSICSLLALRFKTLTAHQNVYAETTFVCPSYWLTEAFTNKGRIGYKYQYSVIGGAHGRDVSAIFGPATPNQSPGFVRAFMSKCTHSDPIRQWNRINTYSAGQQSGAILSQPPTQVSPLPSLPALPILPLP